MRSAEDAGHHGDAGVEDGGAGDDDGGTTDAGNGVVVDRSKLICSYDGWCWENPLPVGASLRAVTYANSGPAVMVG
ncbi:MAG: hypothetical protein WBV82_17355, partial [Myxococcaceae bacterium]